MSATNIAALRHKVQAGNDALAERITNSVGSMWCAYAFAALALVSLPGALASHNAVVIVAWVAQTFLQLVLLPIIIVGQAVQQRRHDEHAAKLDAIHQAVSSNEG